MCSSHCHVKYWLVNEDLGQQKSESLTGKQALKLEQICAIIMKFSDKVYFSPRQRYFAYIIVLILGNTDVFIKVKFSLSC